MPNWITLTESDVRTVLSGTELAAYRSIAQGSGEADPVPLAIADVTAEARGYLSRVTTLGPSGTVADVVKRQCLALICVSIIGRCGKSPSKERTDAAAKAVERLKTITQIEVSGGGVTVASSNDRLNTRDSMLGL